MGVLPRYHMASRFLPEDFPTGSPIALLAGKGRYPEILRQRMQEAGHPVYLCGYEGETDPALMHQVPEANRAMIKVGQLGKMLKILRRWPVSYAVMAGQITPGKLFRGLHPDIKAITILARLKERNAETIFGAIAREIEALNITLLDARAFMDDDLVGQGVLAKGRFYPTPEDLGHGIRMAKEIARLDIGQGVVVRRGTVLAVEAFEGTDAMLRRAGSFRTDGTLFVKTHKPGQDTRFDVPVFGAQTLAIMQEQGIQAAALETGYCLILDQAKTLAEAHKQGITLLGYPPPVE